MHTLYQQECHGNRYLVHPDDLLDYLPYGLYLPPTMSCTESVRFIVLKHNYIVIMNYLMNDQKLIIFHT